MRQAGVYAQTVLARQHITSHIEAIDFRSGLVPMVEISSQLGVGRDPVCVPYSCIDAELILCCIALQVIQSFSV